MPRGDKCRCPGLTDEYWFSREEQAGRAGRQLNVLFGDDGTTIYSPGRSLLDELRGALALATSPLLRSGITPEAATRAANFIRDAEGMTTMRDVVNEAEEVVDNTNLTGPVGPSEAARRKFLSLATGLSEEWREDRSLPLPEERTEYQAANEAWQEVRRAEEEDAQPLDYYS